MRKLKILAAALTAVSVFVCAYAATAKTAGNVKKSAKGWRKIIWVDEKGVRHVTLVSPRTRDEEETAPPSSSASEESLPRIITAKVVRADDMETIRLADGRVVRYIGVSGPPKNTPAFKQALRFHKKMVEKKWVNILPGRKPRAPDGSILAFVFVNRMTFVNAELIRHGWARSHPVKPNVQYRVLFDRLENRAKSRGLGMWKE